MVQSQLQEFAVSYDKVRQNEILTVKTTNQIATVLLVEQQHKRSMLNVFAFSFYLNLEDYSRCKYFKI